VGRNKSEPVRTKDHVGVQDAVCSDDGSGIKNHTRVEHASRPNNNVFGELNSRGDDGAGVDASGAI
jgi:hypothetical protein